MKHATLLGLFLLGCATGGVASSLVIPAARAGADPVRWEYLCTDTATVDQLNKAGAQGWELVGIAQMESPRKLLFPEQNLAFCFKRALP